MAFTASGCILLYPVRNPGQVADGQLLDVRIGAVGGFLGQRHVFLAPDHQRGHPDHRESLLTLPAGAAAADQGAVVVDHGR